MLELTGVSKRYGPAQVLTGTNLHIAITKVGRFIAWILGEFDLEFDGPGTAAQCRRELGAVNQVGRTGSRRCATEC